MVPTLSYPLDMMGFTLRVFSAFSRGMGLILQRGAQPLFCSHLMRLWILNNAAVVEGLCPVSLRDRHIRDSDLPSPGQPRLFSLLSFPSPLTPGTQL